MRVRDTLKREKIKQANDFRNVTDEQCLASMLTQCDSDIITANGTASLEFAREIMLYLNLKPVGKIDEWYKFNKLGFYQK
ncbi:hypothetical protein [Clostridium estertheticum]|uniref:hypothetical protein n=1 Tax=Clostridium estertheticum TaxID=238834 RepID=UPI00217E5F4A|nr:hypothetical protein [Clostridium estertheticum]